MTQFTAIHLIEEGLYIVKTSYCSGQIVVNDIEIPRSQGEIVVSDLNQIKEFVKKPRQIIHYENENGDVLSVDEYKQTINRLTQNLPSNENTLEYIFDNLDDEYNYKKFIQQWIPVLSPEETVERPVEIEIVEIRTNSGDPDIISLWNSSSIPSEQKLYALDRNALAIKVATQICNENGQSFELSSIRKTLEFAKINGDYIFGQRCKFPEVNFIGTLQQAKDIKEHVIKTVKDSFSLYIAKKTQKQLTSGSDVLNELRIIRSIIDSSTKNDIKIKINMLCTKIEQDLIG